MAAHGLLAVAGLLVLLLVPTTSQPTPAELAAAADAACSGLNNVHIPDPSDRRDIYHVSGADREALCACLGMSS
jgi:hypothetical protein